jgi:hypothetical protein
MVQIATAAADRVRSVGVVSRICDAAIWTLVVFVWVEGLVEGVGDIADSLC